MSDRPWVVSLTCCGRDDGIYRAASWQEADNFRDDYTSGTAVDPHGYSGSGYNGHRRSAVISRTGAKWQEVHRG